MSNWVKTRCCVSPKRNDKKSYRDFIELCDYLETHVEDLNPLESWGFLEGDERITMDTYNEGQIVVDRERGVVIFSIISPWVCPFWVLELFVTKFKLGMMFSWSDETENHYDVPYGEDDWWNETGSCGIGIYFSCDGDQLGYIYDYPRTDVEHHEFFLSSWNHTQPWDGGSRFPFFDQNNIEFKYPSFIMNEDFKDWIKRKFRDKRKVVTPFK